MSNTPLDVVRGIYAAFAAVPSEFVADGSTVVALGEYSATYKATGKSFRARECFASDSTTRH
jgi:hypothetical protein